jgi:hypothetical protein
MSSTLSLRRALPAVLALWASLSAGAAHAGGVQWSIGINLPPPPIVVYEPAPEVIYAPPMRRAPRPYYAEPRVVYAPREVEREEWCPPRYERRHSHHHDERRAGGWGRYEERYGYRD